MAGDRSDEDDNNNNNIILPLSVYRLQMSDPTRYMRRSVRASMSFPQCSGEVVTASGTLDHTYTCIWVRRMTSATTMTSLQPYSCISVHYALY